MKNLFIAILCVCAFSFTAEAQIEAGGDSIVNGGSSAVSFKAGGGETSMAVQIVVSKNSGTVAGSCVLQASLDNSNWYIASSDTLSLTDVALQTQIWTIAPNPYPYLRCSCTGSGTMVAGYVVEYFRRN